MVEPTKTRVDCIVENRFSLSIYIYVDLNLNQCARDLGENS